MGIHQSQTSPAPTLWRKMEGNLFLGALSQVSREHCETTSTGGTQRDWNSACQLRVATDAQANPLVRSNAPSRIRTLRTRLRRALPCHDLTSANAPLGASLGRQS